MSNFSLTKEQCLRFCQAGAMAPSGGNLQPWSVTIHPDVWEISLVPERIDTILDYQRAASVFALGAFVENVILAAQAEQIACHIAWQEADDIRVQLTFSPEDTTDPETLKLAKSIPQRMTSRTMSDGTAILESDITVLLQAFTENQNIKIAFINAEPDKKRFADLIGKSDGIRTLHDGLFEQMMAEMRFTQKEVEETRDGMDVKTLELPGNVVSMLGLLAKHPGMRKIIPKKAFEDQVKPLLRSASHVACVYLNEPVSTTLLFESGRKVERLWLQATEVDIRLQPWTVQTFIAMRAQDETDTVFTIEEKQEIIGINQEISSLFALPQTGIPLFLFRLYRGKQSKIRSLRLDWTQFVRFV